MRLLLLRHGSAVRRGAQADADRPLTAAGEVQARAAAAALVRLRLVPERVLASPVRRCRRTAEIVVEQLQPSDVPLTCVDALAGGATPQKLLQLIADGADAQRVLVVGHQPDLEGLASYLLVGSGDAVLHLEPGGCICLESAKPGPPAILRWSMTPEQLRRIASSAAAGRREPT
ncbi:MAG: histidine phosphatase family protein [Candidatus Latescibacterota bacterium]|nr:MAG: histidine phosphatase family protein [Candidatus Latescibacterota bacterium]